MNVRENMKAKSTIDLSAFADAWPAPYVERQKIGEFSGGLIEPKTLANLDSQNKGPEGRIKVGKKVIYPVKAIIQWLEARASKPSKGKVGAGE
jgi:hypothetical protein